ncbi:MAG: hypothetical protein IIU51_05785 [Bacteroidaceae bacterium]|nr:hypothetical protein [Bacteroidaceae bacterium]MBQ5374048.1 hypothetical protein [Bacteroidaceae bacterium]
MKKELIKKGDNRTGRITQKMMSFRLDNDLEVYLKKQVNKGRYINNLIREDRDKNSIEEGGE